jgi:hypothetical protein
MSGLLQQIIREGKVMKALSFGLLLMASMAFVLLGCSDNSTSPVGPASQPNLTSPSSDVLSKADGSIKLEGFTRFDIYALQEHRVIMDGGEWNLPCTAELTFTDKHNFVLHSKEYANPDYTGLFREIFFEGKMTPGGLLEFAWPKTWLEVQDWESMVLVQHSNVIAQMKDHMGYDLYGPGVHKNTVIYVGDFRNNKFAAAFHLVGFYREPGSMGAPYDVVVKGPISVSFSFDLRVSQ